MYGESLATTSLTSYCTATHIFRQFNKTLPWLGHTRFSTPPKASGKQAHIQHTLSYAL